MNPLCNFQKNRLQLINKTLMMCDDVLGEKYAKSRVASVLNDVVLSVPSSRYCTEKFCIIGVASVGQNIEGGYW